MVPYQYSLHKYVIQLSTLVASPVGLLIILFIPSGTVCGLEGYKVREDFAFITLDQRNVAVLPIFLKFCTPHLLTSESALSPSRRPALLLSSCESWSSCNPFSVSGTLEKSQSLSLPFLLPTRYWFLFSVLDVASLSCAYGACSTGQIQLQIPLLHRHSYIYGHVLH